MNDVCDCCEQDDQPTRVYYQAREVIRLRDDCFTLLARDGVFDS